MCKQRAKWAVTFSTSLRVLVILLLPPVQESHAQEQTASRKEDQSAFVELVLLLAESRQKLKTEKQKNANLDGQLRRSKIEVEVMKNDLSEKEQELEKTRVLAKTATFELNASQVSKLTLENKLAEMQRAVKSAKE